MDYETILSEVYVEYLASSLGPATATELAEISSQAVSHDQVTRALAGPEHGSKELWKVVKPLVRRRALEDGSRGAVLVIDDTIIEKPHSTPSEVVGWYFDHTKGRCVKGINLLTLFWQSAPDADGQRVQLPVGYEVVRKGATLNARGRPTSKVDKNTLVRGLLRQARANAVPFEAVLADCWFASEQTLEMIHQELGAAFVFALKGNRQAVPAGESRRGAGWKTLKELELEEDCACAVQLRGLCFPVAVVRHRYENLSGRAVDIFIGTNSLELSGPQTLACHQRRWSIEVYHKSLKQNAGAGRALLSRVRSQLNHLWSSLCAYVRWERLKLRQRLNHFALKAKMRHAAQKHATDAFRQMSTA